MASAFVNNIMIFIVIAIAFLIFWSVFTRVSGGISRLAKAEIGRSKIENGLFSTIESTTSDILNGLGHKSAEVVKDSGEIEQPQPQTDEKSLKGYKRGIKKIDSSIQSLRKSLNEDRKSITRLKGETASKLSELEIEQNKLNGLDYPDIATPAKSDIANKVGEYNRLLMTLQSMEVNDQQHVDNIRAKIRDMEALVSKAMYDIDLAISTETNPEHIKNALDEFIEKLIELQTLEIDARLMQDERKQFLNNISQLSIKLDSIEKDVKNKVNQTISAVKDAKKEKQEEIVKVAEAAAKATVEKAVKKEAA